MKKNIRNDFPILKQKMNGHPLIYFDNASTSQKPQAVLDALMNFYTTTNANIHRGIYTIGEQATQAYEDARVKVARFINAQDPSEIVFTSGTTESINLVASTWGVCDLEEGDEILITELEHHSNMVPWQLLAYKQSAKLKFIPVLPDGRLDTKTLSKLITSRTKIVSLSHVSNALGVHNGIQDIITAAHAVDAMVMIDAAQSVPHQPIDVQAMNCDFLAFSGHKMLAPTGIGVLYIKKDLHDFMSPYQVGGGMVQEVDFKEATWRSMPQKLEAGTPPIAQAIGLGAAIDYLQSSVDWAALRAHEAALCTQLIDGLSTIPSIKLLGPLDELKKVGHMVSFTVDGMHPHDVAAYLNNYGICVRAGHHCAQPLAKKLGIEASVRVSFYCYNTVAEVKYFIEVMKKIHTVL
ncbi:MAG: cysteine desulfurase [Candidatus Dependentiae bacterium]|nr:cysteine desulfurase [Candidatus Dependentiae bacterium]